SLGTAVSRTGVFLKKQLWMWPVIATVLLGIIGFIVHRSIAATMKANLRSQLETLLTVETEMLENWIHTNAANAAALANSQPIRESIYELLDAHEPAEEGKPRTDLVEIRRKLQKQFGPTLASHSYAGYIVVDKSQRIVAAATEELIGRQTIPEYEAILSRALKGETTIGSPFGSVVTLKDETGRLRTGVPTMFVVAPVRDASFEIVAAVALRIRPELEFTRILQLGRFGESGETYAFDKTGLMVSNSRFDDDLILTGILPDRDGVRSILNVHLRDPGGNMTEGFRPKVRRSEQPLTKCAAAAIAGNSGVDIDSYRDYRGVPVVGAWTWLPEYDLGVTTEIDLDEAYRPLTILQWTFRSLLGLLAASSLAIFLFSVRVARLQREAQKAAIEMKQLGQYTLEHKLGAGGMGVVYKGHHAMLRRPTAIKMLDVDKVNDGSIQRFEREVQITCQLNHPNTVAIYDYGRTPEGVFYYAMEYLDGIDLQTLVEKYGPQPEARVIQILLQVCGSLYEAHSLGLVHRDIKPANIMLNRRGAEADVVKVLDFGLVKAVDDAKQAGLTAAGSLTGTPLYMAPEAIQSPNSVDARSDLYAVGAVGYFLLTGHPVFEAGNLVQLCQQHIDAIPVPPSQRLGRPISTEVETALLASLEKMRTRRPQTARDLAQQLQKAPTKGDWTTEAADAWWDRHQRGLPPAPSPTADAAEDSQYSRTYVTDMGAEPPE
ncbi:MAG: serine/threonine protein kinase, partial [Planctomycetaceae bacterium]|nr:serine/threonine protein kinase [Planctomycetaceae bacterium]